jgi:hypothetical protein
VSISLNRRADTAFYPLCVNQFNDYNCSWQVCNGAEFLAQDLEGALKRKMMLASKKSQAGFSRRLGIVRKF